MSSLNDPGPGHGPRYWKTLTELAENAHSVGSPEVPNPVDGQVIDPLSRRSFFRLMGASMALAGIAGPGCQRYEREEIVPLSRRPEDQVPGTPLQYASVFELAGWGQPLLVSSYEGRPIHVDGNPQHPFTGDGLADNVAFHRHAGSSPYAAASVLNVYDQDRSKSPLQKGKGATFDDFKNWLAAARADMKANPGSVRILSEAMSSPTLATIRRALLAQLGGAQWVEWEPISFDNERAGLKLAFGRPLRAFAHLDRAETIVTLDGDLFVEHPAGLRYARDWKKSRGPEGSSLGDGKMNRLWSIESTFTATGAVADHRLPLRSELILPFVNALDAALSGGAQPTSEFLNEAKVAKFVRVLAAELKANRGKAVVVAGRRQSPHVHALVAKINDAIGAVGTTLDYLDDGDDRPTHGEAIAKLADDIKNKQVKYLFILGGNPVYDAPADLDFASAIGTVENTVHLSEWEDETSEKCLWHVPRANYLESWGDARTWDGTWTIQQPLIMPLYGGISAIELASLVGGDEKTGESLVRAAVESSGGGAAWRKCVHDGFVANTALTPASAAIGPMPVVQLSPTQLGGSRLKNGSLEVVYHFSSNTWDGRFANNAWLQETPDFFTKVVWDNYALVGPATAQDLHVENDTKIKVKVDGRELEIGCYVMPGQAPGSIGLVLGGGRTRAGSKGGTSAESSVGFDTYKLRSSKALDYSTGASVDAVGESYKFSGVQEHWDIRNGIDKSLFGADVGGDGTAERLPELIREVNATTYRAGDWDARPEDEFWREPGTWVDAQGAVVLGPPDSEDEAKARHLTKQGDHWVDANGVEILPLPVSETEGNVRGLTKKSGRGHSLFQEKTYESHHRWGMSIDLGSCISCNACMIACQSENNIPVVGKDQVAKNREMHWIRIDRYFEGTPDDPHIVNQPVTCQQCENAPCEQVCPVGATSHSSEGLNDMAYNRCVGTRYCLNNCPYRVRRFNFLDWNKEFKEARNRVRKLVMNPEVTVRMRGVMEKCTYCVQRIQNKKIVAKNERRDLQDGEITTACQDACPTGAIIFGDLADANSWVTKLQMDRRSYELLGQLNTKPRTQYLARVRNPNPELG